MLVDAEANENISRNIKTGYGHRVVPSVDRYFPMQSQPQRVWEDLLKSTLRRRGLPLYRNERHKDGPLGAEFSHPCERFVLVPAAHERAVFDIDRPQLAAEQIEFVHLILRRGLLAVARNRANLASCPDIKLLSRLRWQTSGPNLANSGGAPLRRERSRRAAAVQPDR